MTEIQYDQVRIKVAGHHPPEGALYHVAGPPDTGWCVVEVWDSPEALQRRVDEKIKAVLEKSDAPHSLGSPQSPGSCTRKPMPLTHITRPSRRYV